VSVPVSISECQLVVTLASTLLLVVVAGVVVTGVVVAGVVVARVVVLRVLVVSTVTAAVISSSQDIFKTEEPDTNTVLSWSLAPPPPSTVTAIVVTTKQSKQTSVRVLTIGLSFPPAAGVVVVAVEVVVAAAIKSPTEKSTTYKAGTDTENSAINRLVSCSETEKPRVCGGILASRAAAAAAP